MVRSFSIITMSSHIQPLVSDSLGQEANQCTVVATYGRLVVGAALLSSPEETYITYLVVRTGWETAQIATYAAFPSTFNHILI